MLQAMVQMFWDRGKPQVPTITRCTRDSQLLVFPALVRKFFVFPSFSHATDQQPLNESGSVQIVS